MMFVNNVVNLAMINEMGPATVFLLIHEDFLLTESLILTTGYTYSHIDLSKP